MDEVILADAIRTKAENPWAKPREALVLYAQNARPMLVNAAWQTLIAWLLAFALACNLQVLLWVPEGQTPYPGWEAKLIRASYRFRTLGEQAANWAGSRFGSARAG